VDKHTTTPRNTRGDRQRSEQRAGACLPRTLLLGAVAASTLSVALLTFDPRHSDLAYGGLGIALLATLAAALLVAFRAFLHLVEIVAQLLAALLALLALPFALLPRGIALGVFLLVLALTRLARRGRRGPPPPHRLLPSQEDAPPITLVDRKRGTRAA
jgi:hypothetical protein